MPTAWDAAGPEGAAGVGGWDGACGRSPGMLSNCVLGRTLGTYFVGLMEELVLMVDSIFHS
jgi:hypothetical protein